MKTTSSQQDDPADVLLACRERIDRIDGVLLALLRERLLTAEEAADAKTAMGQPVLAPPREAEVLARVTSLANWPLDPDAAVRIFGTIIEETRATAQRRAEAQAPGHRDGGSATGS